MKVMVFGVSGMLGSATLKTFTQAGHDVVATGRQSSWQGPLYGAKYAKFDARQDDVCSLLDTLDEDDVAINAIGVIKPHIDESSPVSIRNAVEVNAVFPARLEAAAADRGVRVIQIATDCVYSGARGAYLESDPHDALDVYGKSKSLGETPGSSIMHLRASIVGPEQDRTTSLLEWVRNQPPEASISGFTNHMWNGVTTRAFARVCLGIAESDQFSPGTHHLLPAGTVTKMELVSLLAVAFDRPDISVAPTQAPTAVDRTLSTHDIAANERRWQLAGYPQVPTVADLVWEAAKWESLRV